MLVSNECVEMIKDFEGCRLTAYRDVAGVPTIGYGHTNGVYMGMTIDDDTAHKFLLKDIMKFEKHVNEYDSIYHWTQYEFDALVSFAFNIGSIKQLTQNGTRNKQTIAEYMLKYVFANHVKCDGLVTRRQHEHDMFIGKNVSRETLVININEYTTLGDIVDMILNGDFGNGDERKEKLYSTIQSLVNKRLGV